MGRDTTRNIAIVSSFLRLGKPLKECGLSDSEIEEALAFIKAEEPIEVEEDFEINPSI